MLPSGYRPHDIRRDASHDLHTRILSIGYYTISVHTYAGAGGRIFVRTLDNRRAMSNSVIVIVIYSNGG